MDILREYPPNYDEIVHRIPEAAQDDVIFAYSPYVYVPSGRHLTGALQSHEAVHLQQQQDDPAGWWERYLDSVFFRFGQELEAHRAEYAWWKKWRPQKAQKAKRLIAARLRSPLYGAQELLSEVQAIELLETQEDLDNL